MSTDHVTTEARTQLRSIDELRYKLNYNRELQDLSLEGVQIRSRGDSKRGNVLFGTCRDLYKRSYSETQDEPVERPKCVGERVSIG